MTTPYDVLKEHFTANEWVFEEHDEDKVVVLNFTSENAQYRCLAAIDDDDDLIQCFAYFPTKVPGNKRGDISELICRANHGMKIGKFEIDYSDGEVRYQTSSAFMAGVLPEEVVRRMFGVCFMMADRYYPAFMKVLFSNISPEKAVAEVES